MFLKSPPCSPSFHSTQSRLNSGVVSGCNRSGQLIHRSTNLLVLFRHLFSRHERIDPARPCCCNLSNSNSNERMYFDSASIWPLQMKKKTAPQKDETIQFVFIVLLEVRNASLFSFEFHWVTQSIVLRRFQSLTRIIKQLRN